MPVPPLAILAPTIQPLPVPEKTISAITNILFEDDAGVMLTLSPLISTKLVLVVETTVL